MTDDAQPFLPSGTEALYVLAFDELARAALALRMAGYSEPQVRKLLARGHGIDDPAAMPRRAA